MTADISFGAMGTQARVAVGEPAPGEMDPVERAEVCREAILDFDRRLSRFRPESELSRLNSDPRGEVPVSPLLLCALRAGAWAAEASGGLCDPTLLRPIVSAGYAQSRGRSPNRARLRDALAWAPPRRPASPSSALSWTLFEADERAGVVRRPPGTGFDTGGTGKGLIADLVADSLGGYSYFIVDCGGDMRLGGFDAWRMPFDVRVEHPLTGERSFGLRLSAGGVATTAIDRRIWETEGGFAHHLLDPASGDPAWTGLIGATALAPSALEAETLAKSAVLHGPEGARRVLRKHGGIVFHDSGRLELVSPGLVAATVDGVEIASGVLGGRG